MAEFLNNPSSYRTGASYEALSDDAETGGQAIELSAIPRARASRAFSKETLPAGDYGDEVSLISHSRKHSHVGASKSPDVSSLVLSHATSHAPTTASNRTRRRRLQGWRFGVAVSGYTAFTVLMLNLIITVYVTTKFGDTIDDGVGTAYSGSCEVVNQWTKWSHIAINVLSSILLSASNYTMQCLCSPTRRELDRAHAKGDWMDIGVASVRNIFKIHWQRSALWWLLAVSSVPIHLLYNSAIFKTLDAYEYTMAVVSPAFLDGLPFATSYQTADGSLVTVSALSQVQSMQDGFAQDAAYQNGALFQNLTNSECMAAYGTSFVTGRSQVLAITNELSEQSNETAYFVQTTAIQNPQEVSGLPYGWICLDSQTGTTQSADDIKTCDIPSSRRNATNWTIIGKKIDHCISQTVPSGCKLQFSVYILTAVILMNASKMLVMFVTFYRHQDATLVTIGDALKSFLDQPDELTKGRCLMAKIDIDKGPLRWRIKSTARPHTDPPPILFQAALQRRWFAAASPKRWCVTLGMCAVGLIAGASLLGQGVTSLQAYLNGQQSVFSLGFGAVDSRALVNAQLPSGGASGLVFAVLLANLPQALMSFLYLAYNGLLTSMCLCHEYSSYGVRGRRKPLRVTTRHGQQRSTYYLQLPYTYSLPLLLASGTLHWLTSQSIFLARVTVHANGDPTNTTDTSQIGYSCLPILLVILLGSTMVLIALSLGFRKFASAIPVAGSCSVAIAAAAHRPKDDVDAAFMPVAWGAVVTEDSSDVGHCCFTSDDVHEMVPGRRYAGVLGWDDRSLESETHAKGS